MLFAVAAAVPGYFVFKAALGGSGAKGPYAGYKAKKIILAEVLNASGATGVGSKLTTYLRENQVDVIQSGNYFSFDVENTLIIDRSGNPANALAIARLLMLDERAVIRQINKNYYLDVTVLAGKDFTQLPPFKEPNVR